MKYARENLMSPQELAKEFGISVQRLADLRSQGKGPPYFRFGGIWYPKEGFDLWAETVMKGKSIVTEKEKRPLALPVPVQRTGIHREHRFGRHVTKQAKRASYRDSSAAGTEARETPGREHGIDHLP